MKEWTNYNITNWTQTSTKKWDDEEEEVSNNYIKIVDWACRRLQIALIDLSNINDVFESIGTNPVDGIIGADILKKGNTFFLWYTL